MGTGFWLIQAVFVAAAIATAVSAELENRHDDASRVSISVASPFTRLEEVRLRRLRQRVQQAIAGENALSDDLTAESADGTASHGGTRWSTIAWCVTVVGLFSAGVYAVWYFSR